MNRYLVYVTGTDNIGYAFMQNVVELAGKGATLKADTTPCMRFPYSAWFFLETEELMQDRPGVKFQIIEEKYTRDQLDDMSWEQLKKVVKKAYGITGRDRAVLSREYLKAAFGENSPEFV